ncbi:GIY-YIG_nuclease [Hexamita inflata]|uniref:GIY-YIG nuclease n=1 Tax=Hexamita inflata TaxID=28002 RepID=A0AA86UM25_9EUKA|nr:GIY-YIG nuclease [Hexamita inflata]
MSGQNNVEQYNNQNDAQNENTVYAYECVNNTYYVGSTRNFDERTQTHLQNKASEWTKLNPIQRLIYKDQGTLEQELIVTLKLMKEVGIERVRGANFVKLQLSEEEIQIIKNMISHLNNECFICNQQGHLSKFCPKKRTIKQQNANIKQQQQVNHQNNQQNTYQQKQTKKPIVCNKCQKIGHYANQCYVKQNQNKDQYHYRNDNDNIECYKCKGEGHYADECPTKFYDKYDKYTCYTCNGKGHCSPECPNNW